MGVEFYEQQRRFFKQQWGQDKVILRLSREDSCFDLGMEVGNLDAYCQTVIEAVIEAIAMERRNAHYEYPGTAALQYLVVYEWLTAKFSWIVGKKFDHERIIADLVLVYSYIADYVDEAFGDWNRECPSCIRFTLTPGFFEFEIGE